MANSSTNSMERLYNVYKHGTFVQTPPIILPNSPHRLIWWKGLVPLVLAEELAAVQNENTPKSTMERLAESKPLVVVSDNEIRECIAKESGRERLEHMFTKTEKGKYSPEVEFIGSTTKTCGVVTFMFTSVLGARAAREKAIKKQQTVKFDQKIQAVRRLNDLTLVGGFKMGIAYGLKTSVFVALFMLTSQSISVYRNKTSVLEYGVAGALTGALARFFLGPKGMVGGGAVGGTLGIIGGSAMYFIFKSANETTEQRHYWYIHEKLKKKKEMALLAKGVTWSE